MDHPAKPVIGISTCLLGENVRYDGGHKLDRFIRDTLGKYVRFVPVCPEVECGMGVPREALRLVGDPENPRLRTQKTRRDCTQQMQTWGRDKLKKLEKENLDGYIFKSKSPSSGMQRIKVYNDKGHPVPKGVGIWARMFMDHFPLLPVEDDGRLNDPVLRENFISRIFILAGWRKLLAKDKTPKGLVDFHTRHKLLIMAHHLPTYREMGRLVANWDKEPVAELYSLYQKKLVYVLSLKQTVKKNVNVLQHAAGYFKKDITGEEKKELQEIIDNYRQELLPLIVPVTLINHYVRKYEKTYLKDQVYLNPHPMELKLRNHV
ncbi:MAG: YbgA family protein [Desulfonatronovibrionaceae bacterium]